MTSTGMFDKRSGECALNLEKCSVKSFTARTMLRLCCLTQRVWRTKFPWERRLIVFGTRSPSVSKRKMKLLRALFSVLLLIGPLPYANARPNKVTPRLNTYIPELTRGTASWYGRHEQGHLMANGFRFNRFRFTAASRTLPLGARVQVLNLRNGLHTIVTVTDRGPWIPGRILDLAETPARLINCLGLCNIEITPVPSIYSLLPGNCFTQQVLP